MGNSIHDTVREFIIDNFLFGDDTGLEDNTSFLNSGIIDSTGILEVVSFLESTFSFKIADVELIPENFDSIDNITSFVTTKCSN